jgi:hypothetical protein
MAARLKEGAEQMIFITPSSESTLCRPRPNSDTGGEFGDGRKSRGLRHFDSRLSVSLCESRRFLIDNFSFHLILQSMDGHVASNSPNRPGS